MRRLFGIICLFRGHEVEAAPQETRDCPLGMVHHRCPRCHVRVFGGLRRFINQTGKEEARR